MVLIVAMHLALTVSEAIAEPPGSPGGSRSVADVIGQADQALQEGKSELAKELYTRAIVADPMNPELYLRRGAAFEAIGDADKSIQDYQQAVSSIHYRMAALCWQTGRLAEAIKNFDRVLEIQPEFARAYYDRGYVWKELNEPKKAIADFTESIRLEPNFPSTYVERGMLRYTVEDVANAFQDFDDAIRAAPAFVAAYGTRAYYWVREGKPEKAVADYRKAIEVDPNDPSGHNGLAWLLATYPDKKVRDGKQALTHAQKAVELTESADWQYLDTLAAAYAETGDFDAAKKWIAKSLELAPEHERQALRDRRKLYESKSPYRQEIVER